MEGRNINISITSGTVMKTVVILALAWLLFHLRDVVLIVVTAIVIASAVEPGVRAIARHRIPRVLAVLAVYLVMVGVFFVIFYFFLPSVLSDFATFLSSVPNYLEAFNRTGAFDQYANILGVPAPSSISADQIMESIRSAFNLGGVFGNAVTAASKIFGGVFSFVLILVFSFYFAVIETGVDDFLRVVTPRSHKAYILGLWKRSQHKIGLWMQGQLLLGVLMGVLVYLGLTILGVPHALVLAVIAAVFEIIPVFGPTLAAIPAVTIAFVDGGATHGLFTVAFYVIAQQFENHLIYPLVVTRVVGVPPLLVILGLIIGAELAGFLGIILSVPVAAALQEFVNDLESGKIPSAE
ncbi:MAG TPA: AI-2E family transporter [Candidatus Paceibacterota bacterium]|jgi:predicted PurR-regulated permease PerM|nr:AI-2E family transporter [Candidatus Paceibacterota bacterium]